MSQHIVRQIERLKERILHVGSLAETAIADAIAALTQADEQSAIRVLEQNVDLDRAAVDVEEECLKTLALYQPAVGDLRLVVAILKIAHDLERINELAKNIAKRVLYLLKSDGPKDAIDFRTMANHAQKMVHASLAALVRGDSNLAHQVRREDDELDAMRRLVHEEIRGLIRKSPQHAEPLLKLYAIAKHLERIGDMATSIAADVIYMVDAVIVRHCKEEE
jgi:phosphate transport system protein